MNKRFLIFIIILLAISGGVLFALKAPYFSDQEIPVIEILNPPLGMNKNSYNLEVKLSDQDSGLAGFALRANFRNKLYDLIKMDLHGEKIFKESLLVDLTKFNFPQGKIELELRVFDRSLSSNYTTKRIPIILDYEVPIIRAVSAQHNTMPGGVEPIFYEASDKFLSNTGIIQGNQFFQGYLASLVDIKFRNPNLYVAFFSIDPEDTSRPKLYATDQSGNIKMTRFKYNLMPRRFNQQKIKVEKDFLDVFLQTTNSDDISQIANNFLIKSKEESAEIKQILDKVTNNQMLWNGSFLQAEGVVNFAFHDNLIFSHNNQEFINFKSSGFFLNTKSDQPILALQSGEVAFVGTLPLRGKTILINHGLGITSVYSHLQEILVDEGQVVEQGLEIGLSGKSGLARKIGYGLEILSSGRVINPLSWWDQNWYDGHIENKILEIKRLYNIPILDKAN